MLSIYGIWEHHLQLVTQDLIQSARHIQKAIMKVISNRTNIDFLSDHSKTTKKLFLKT